MCQRLRRENIGERAHERLLVLGELLFRKLRQLEQLAQPAEEFRLEGADRHVAAVRRRVHAVTREAAGEHGRARGEPVRTVGHRDDDALADAGPFALEQRREDLRHRTERARCEVGDLNGRNRVAEHSRPADVVQIVSRALFVRAAGAEARDRAVHGARRYVVGPDAEPLRDAGTERLEHDVGAREQCPRKCSIARKVADDRLLASIEQVVPRGRGHAHRVASRLLEPDHTRPEAEQFGRCKGPGHVPRGIDNENPLHPRRTYHYPHAVLAVRQIGSEEKRRLILDAAVRVFAQKGFHTSRVGDIAEEAGVAHGLLYHYFSSKDEVLETIFRENWDVLVARIQAVADSDEPVRDQLRHVAAILLRTWLHTPDVVRVIIGEISRTHAVEHRIGELERPIEVIREIVERGQASGEIRAELDPRLAAVVFYGGIDELLTGWVLGRMPDSPEDVAVAERTFVDALCAGLFS